MTVGRLRWPRTDGWRNIAITLIDPVLVQIAAPGQFSVVVKSPDFSSQREQRDMTEAFG
jgi:hypothetical protein